MAAPFVDVLAPLERSPVKTVPSPVVLNPKAAIYTRIETVLGSELPPSARKFAGWWGTVPPAIGQATPTQVWVLPAASKPEGS